MSSPNPLQHETYYHIYNRGVNRENIFVEERNYAYFLRLYEKYIDPIVETFAYCLLRNHFHLLVRIKSREEIPRETLRVSETLRVWAPSTRFSDFFNAYAKSINKAYGRTGSLFQHPFGRVPIKDDRQFYCVVMYIHQNPQKAGMVQDVADYRWSSYNDYLNSRGLTDIDYALKIFSETNEKAKLRYISQEKNI